MREPVFVFHELEGAWISTGIACRKLLWWQCLCNIINIQFSSFSSSLFRVLSCQLPQVGHDIPWEINLNAHHHIQKKYLWEVCYRYVKPHQTHVYFHSHMYLICLIMNSCLYKECEQSGTHSPVVTDWLKVHFVILSRYFHDIVQ